MHYLELLCGSNFTLCIAVFVFFAIFALLRGSRPNLPPGPRGLPLVGYLPFLTEEPHMKLHELSKKYGDIFGLYMGRTYFVVVTDNAVGRELFNKVTVSDRPPNLFHALPDGAGVPDKVSETEEIQQVSTKFLDRDLTACSPLMLKKLYTLMMN